MYILFYRYKIIKIVISKFCAEMSAENDDPTGNGGGYIEVLPKEQHYWAYKILLIHSLPPIQVSNGQMYGNYCAKKTKILCLHWFVAIFT